MGILAFTNPTTGEKVGKKIPFIPPEFVKSWWASDKEGKTPLTEARLEDTVYFHVDTKGIKEGFEIEFKLYDYDSFLGYNDEFRDILNPDDDKFPDKEIIKTAKVDKNKHASIELKLDNSWEKLIAEEWPLKEIEMYWTADCDEVGLKQDLPADKGQYLKVRYSKRDLYVKPATTGYHLPEMVSSKGGLLLLVNMGQDKAKEFLGGKIDSAISGIALAKLEAGKLISNQGKEYTRGAEVIKTKDVYTSEGKLLKNVSQADNMGNASYTTKGISQYDYFATVGTRVKILGFLKQSLDIFDVYDLFKFAKATHENGLDHSKPLSIPLGPLTPISSLAGILVSEMANDIDQSLEEVFQMQLDEAKELGVEAVKYIAKHNDYRYEVVEIYKSTSQKMLQGKFKTYLELDDFNTTWGIDHYNEEKVAILSRKVTDPITKKDNYIIETLFINE